MFAYCYDLEKIYCNYNWVDDYKFSDYSQDWTYYISSVFNGCSSLPEYSYSKTSMQYAVPTSQGGYFTPKN